MHAILRTLPGLVNELPSGEAREAIVFAIWPSVIGEHLREQSAPKTLQGSTLFVAVADAEWKCEFRQHASQIVYKLNAALGRSVVDRVEFVIDTSTVKPAPRKTKTKRRNDATEHAVEQDIAKAARTIGDTELRAHFLKAAAICIELRDAAAK